MPKAMRWANNACGKRSVAKIASDQPEFQSRRLHRLPDELVMLRGQPLKCAPAHPTRLVALTVENARFPAQARSEPVRTSCCPVARILARASVGKLIAVPAGEDAARRRGPPRAVHSRPPGR
jgi:hypothetical protein